MLDSSGHVLLIDCDIVVGKASRDIDSGFAFHLNTIEKRMSVRVAKLGLMLEVVVESRFNCHFNPLEARQTSLSSISMLRRNNKESASS